MKRIITVLMMLVGLTLLGQSACTAESHAEGGRSEAGSTRDFAVVELFTSEGCSSCPPADRLLAKIRRQSQAKHKPVYPLAFHVTYWDRLGWTDPFGDKAYSQRQSQYARAFNNDHVYTPQMVINGQAQFVGSNAAKAHAGIARALASDPALGLNIDQTRIKAGPNEGHTLVLAYSLTRPAPEMRLNLAVTEDNLTSDVKRGENAGRNLRHQGVVRVFKQITPRPDGQATLSIPANVDLDKANVILYLQQPKTMTIPAATGKAISRSETHAGKSGLGSNAS